MLASGRPCLIVPYAGAANTIGSRVKVAWDASREASRAIHDALPILQSARQVDVVAIAPARRGQRQGPTPAGDVALHLTRHGVNVEVHELEPVRPT